MTARTTPAGSATAAASVLLTLAAGQFLMTLDSAVMNVSIAQVAEDVGTTVTGVQTAITLYTLVMATAMITGGRIGTMIGHRLAFAVGCVVYGVGSATTALAPNLTVLIVGWSVLEGLGAALIMPAIVALVAANVAAPGRPRAYGLVAAAGAVAVAAGPLVGGAVTTFWTWRLVFVGEVGVVLVILLLTRRLRGVPAEGWTGLDGGGVVLSALGLGAAVLGVLRSGTWGWVRPKPSAPELLGLSPTVWLVLGGVVVLWLFAVWERRVVARGAEPLVDLGMLRNARLVGGLTMFFFQFLLQAGLFFTIPLFLSVALGLSALDTGVRLLPLSVTLLVAALGIPRWWPRASPRTVVTAGIGLLLAGIVALVAALEAGAGAGVVTVPLLLAGLGVGALSSQLGAVTVSAVPDERSGEVGGLQNTATNLGASLGTALAGSVLVGALSATFFIGLGDNADLGAEVAQHATVELDSGVPFVSDAQLAAALDEQADLSPTQVDAVLDENTSARLVGLRASLAVLALIAGVALFFARLLPGGPDEGAAAASPGEDGTLRQAA
ncbi:MFS transporter [Luteimicrobium subarcticum]|uniref:MFS transporter n=1 Tax=Luteimicrobium subarcticum TaxID=620910 RepID=A0A2M8WV29_9MICO|nr:MFS transporter [Luteimicrobium subarcticum]PJI94736.1 MFS transporter [Luteimicrobium subarcticum]